MYKYRKENPKSRKYNTNIENKILNINYRKDLIFFLVINRKRNFNESSAF